jgi:hypothetical protein
MRVRFRYSDDHFMLVSGQKSNQTFSKNAANRESKRRKRPSHRRLAIIGIRTAPSKDEVNTYNARKGLSLTMRGSSSDKELNQTD